MARRSSRPQAAVLALVATASCAGGGSGDERGATAGTNPTATATTPTTTPTSSASATTSAGPDGTAGDGPTEADDTATSQGPGFDVGQGGSTGGDCTPVANVELTCDEIDDDCNGFVDDVDLEGDGICDCLSIAIIGSPGSNPASAFEQWLIDRGTSTLRIDPAVVDAATLDPYDVVILDRLGRTYTPAEAMAFEAWVSAGNGLMAMTGHTADPVVAQQWPNSILSTFGLEYQGALLNGPVNDFEVHPVTTGLTSVTFLGGFEVVETIAGSSQVIGSITGPIPVAQVQEHGNGKLLVWGDEWIEFDSEWSTMPEIAMLWSNIFTWLAPADICAPPEG